MSPSLFDSDAILNSGDCTSQTGELLVGPATIDGPTSAIWTGEQISPVAIGSVDNCAFGGFQLPGAVNGPSNASTLILFFFL